MKDAFAWASDIASFVGICLIVALLLWGLSEWARRHRRYWHNWLLHRNRLDYPTVSRADLETEAAATEARYYDLRHYAKHRNEGRHYDAA